MIMVNLMWSVIVIVCYMTVLIVIGVFWFKKADNLSDYFIGGRQLNAWVAALSAHASDMSGWLFMGFVGAVYSLNTGELWIIPGLTLGTFLGWILVAKRLRRYSIISNYSITIPEFLENRFRDSSRILRILSSLIIIVFFTVYTASGFVACGALFSGIFGIDYQIALLIGVLVILAYTFLGGFRAVCWTDFIQSLLMLAAVIAVPLIILGLTRGSRNPAVASLSPRLFTVFKSKSDQAVSPVTILSRFAWGLGYFGMPHILVRFMAAKNERDISKATFIGGFVTVIALCCAAGTGIIAFLIDPNMANSESVFILLIQRFFMTGNVPGVFPLMGSIFLCGILAAIMSTADSQLLLTASAITNDLYHGVIHREGGDKHFLWSSRGSVVVVSAIAYLIATDQSSTVMGLVSNAWSGLGSAFSALILLSLYWKRLNRGGAIAGIIAGGLTVFIWDELLVFKGENAWLSLGQITGLYSIVPGFCISLIFIILVSLLTPPPSQEILDEFEEASVKPIFEE
jgi:sodium/proline symporter